MNNIDINHIIILYATATFFKIPNKCSGLVASFRAKEVFHRYVFFFIKKYY